MTRHGTRAPYLQLFLFDNSGQRHRRRRQCALPAASARFRPGTLRGRTSGTYLLGISVRTTILTGSTAYLSTRRLRVEPTFRSLSLRSPVELEPGLHRRGRQLCYRACGRRGIPDVNSPPADANADGVVDDKDASILGSHWQQMGGAHWFDGDFNDDGNVNDADAAILAAHWGEGGGEESVPEPGSLALLAGATVATLIRRSRRPGRRPGRVTNALGRASRRIAIRPTRSPRASPRLDPSRRSGCRRRPGRRRSRFRRPCTEPTR